MVQTLTPDGNVTQTGVTGGFAEIDEASPSDADFAYGSDGGGNVLEVSLSDVSTPDTGTYTVSYRHALIDGGALAGSGTSGNPLTIEVYEGATQRASTTATMGTSWTTATWTPDLSAITDWTDVRLRFSDTSHGGNPNSRRAMGISWAKIEVPNAAATPTVVTVTAAAMAHGGQTINIVEDTLVPVTAVSMSYSGQTITVSESVRATVDVATMNLAGQTISLIEETAIAVTAGTMNMAGQAITVSNAASDTIIPVLAGTMDYAEQAISVFDETTVIATAGSLAMTGQTINVIQPTVVTVDFATLDYAEQVVAVNAQTTPTVEAASMSYVGQATNILLQTLVSVTVGAMNYVGQTLSTGVEAVSKTWQQIKISIRTGL